MNIRVINYYLQVGYICVDCEFAAAAVNAIRGN